MSLLISYCTTCSNRLWQLALTLPENLENLKDDEEIIIVNYGSKDDLNKYIQASTLCQTKIKENKQRKWTQWHPIWFFS